MRKRNGSAHTGAVIGAVATIVAAMITAGATIFVWYFSGARAEPVSAQADVLSGEPEESGPEGGRAQEDDEREALQSELDKLQSELEEERRRQEEREEQSREEQREEEREAESSAAETPPESSEQDFAGGTPAQRSGGDASGSAEQESSSSPAAGWFVPDEGMTPETVFPDVRAAQTDAVPLSELGWTTNRSGAGKSELKDRFGRTHERYFANAEHYEDAYLTWYEFELGGKYGELRCELVTNPDNPLAFMVDYFIICDGEVVKNGTVTQEIQRIEIEESVRGCETLRIAFETEYWRRDKLLLADSVAVVEGVLTPA